MEKNSDFLELESDTQIFSSAIDLKLKSRLLNRCKLIIKATEKLIKYIEEHAHIDKVLKQLLTKYFTKNILTESQALQSSLKELQSKDVGRNHCDQMRSIFTYIERFNERRLKAGVCRKNSNHYYSLDKSARDLLTNELKKLAGLAALLPLRPEEIEMDPVVNAQAELLHQQQKQAVEDNTFQLALKNVCTWARQCKAEVSVFISYAWSSDHRPWEQWVQPFLQTLQSQLELAGIMVYMDLYDSRYGFNSYHHMDRIETCHYVIVIGTESLLDKFQRGVSAVCYELNEIRKRREQDFKDKVFSVIPIIVNGNMRTALPSEYERFTVIESFLGGNYVQTIKELLAKLYNISPGNPDFVKAWQPCVSLIQQQSQVSISRVTTNLQAEINNETSYFPTNIRQQSTAHSSYLNKLKAVYQDRAFSGVQQLFDEGMIPIEDYYVNLALIKEEEQKAKEKNKEKNLSYNLLEQDEATEFFNSAEQFFTVQEPIELSDIFNDTKNDKANSKTYNTHRMLIIGRAGIGKTTLCQYIVNQWAQGKLWAERYQGVFRIPIRNLIASRYTANREYSIIEIINRECFADRLTEAEQKDLDNVLKNYPEKYLIILDGYDERSSQAEDRYIVKQINMLQNYPKVIITSRPMSIDFTADKKLEILGFTDENIERYVNNFFASHANKEENEIQKENLKQYLQTQPLIKSLAHIPLNLELICNAWQKNNWPENITLTMLYENLVQWLQYRYLKKFHPQYKQAQHLQELNDLTPSDLEELCHDWLEKLGSIAWQMFQLGSIYINKNDIFKIESSIEQRRKLLEQLRESGLLRLTSDNQAYYFAHLTFQEFFVARYAAKLIQQIENRINEQYKIFKNFFIENKFNPKLQVVWWFIAGLLRDDSKALDAYFNLMLQEPRDILIINELPLFIQCIEQSTLLMMSQISKKLIFEVENRVVNLIRLTTVDEKQIIEDLSFNLKICPNFLKKNVLPILLDILRETSEENEKKSIAMALGHFGMHSAKTEVLKIIASYKGEGLALRRLSRVLFDKIKDYFDLNTLMTELINLMKNPEKEVRKGAIDLLESINLAELVGNKILIKSLLKAIEDFDEKVSVAAAKVLRKVGKPAAEIDRMLRNLIMLAQNPNKKIKRKVINILSNLGELAATKEIVSLLQRMLEDSEVSIVRQVIEILGKISNYISTEDICVKLKVFLKDNRLDIRMEAAITLANREDRVSNPHRFAGLLYNLLLDEDIENDVFSTALDQLCEFAINGGILKWLVKLLHDPNLELRRIVAKTIGELIENIASEYVLDALVNAMRDPDLYVRCIAVQALGNLSKQKVTKDLLQELFDVLHDSKENELIQAIAKAIGKIGKYVIEADYLLRKLFVDLSNSNPNVRLAAVEILGELGDIATTREVLQKLFEVLGDNDDSLNRAVIYTIDKLMLGKCIFLEDLQTLLEKFNDTNPKIKVAVIKVLGQSSICEAERQNLSPHFMLALQDSEPNVRQAAAEILGQLYKYTADQYIVNSLLNLLEDPDLSVFLASLKALRQIEGNSKITLKNNLFVALELRDNVDAIKQVCAEIKLYIFRSSKNEKLLLTALINDLLDFSCSPDIFIEEFKGIPLMVRGNIVSWYESSQGLVRVEVTEAILSKLITYFQESIEKLFHVTPFLLSTPLSLNAFTKQIDNDHDLINYQDKKFENINSYAAIDLKMVETDQLHAKIELANTEEAILDQSLLQVASLNYSSPISQPNARNTNINFQINEPHENIPEIKQKKCCLII